MVAIDTNVLVRYLVRDDQKQAEAARTLFESLSIEQPGYVCREVVIELVWVLERAYRCSREQVATILEQLAKTESLVVEAGNDVIRAASRLRSVSADFSDLMILSAAERSRAHCLYTFDQKAARLEGVKLLNVEEDT